VTGPAEGADTQSGGGLAVWLLALGQTLVYTGSYYSFPALLPALEAETGWTKATLAAGPTLAFLVMAALTPGAGRWVDRGRGGLLLTGGPVLAAAGVAGLGLAATPAAWVAAWALIGVAQAGSLYETCFAFLTRRLGAGARGAITRVTLVAGFAGTITFPLGHWLGATFGGQGAMLVFAALILIGVVPVNALAVARLRREARAAALTPPADAPGALRAAMRRVEFWVIAAAVGLIWLNHGIVITYVLALFAAAGAGPALAAGAAACIGPAQVAGRLALLLAGARLSTATATALALASVLGAALLLWAAGAATGLIFAVAALQGAGAGLLSILRPVLTAEVLGRAGFGAISGAIAVPAILASAAAPALGAGLLALGGTDLVKAACIAMAAGGLALGLWLVRRIRA
jgi:uncharacterized membrane protein